MWLMRGSHQGHIGVTPGSCGSSGSIRVQGVHVIWVVREHDPNGIDVEAVRQHLYRDGGAGSTVAGTRGAALVDGLEAAPGEITLVKKRFSAFFHTHLDLLLRRLGVREVAVCGVQTPNCIRATAVDALGLDYGVSVLADATASKSGEVQESNLEDMRCMGIRTPTVAGWAAGLK